MDWLLLDLASSRGVSSAAAGALAAASSTQILWAASLLICQHNLQQDYSKRLDGRGVVRTLLSESISGSEPNLKFFKVER
jgi:hypothetical protein